MISSPTRKALSLAIQSPQEYKSGAPRKQLQATYDKLLDELSIAIFSEPCTNRMSFRQKINSQQSSAEVIRALKEMLRHDHMLFSKSYTDHGQDIAKFLALFVHPFLKALGHDGQQ